MAEPPSRDEINRHVETLNASRDSDRVTASAIALVASEDGEATSNLARALQRAEFLERLDTDSNITNIASVFRTLAAHPSEAVSRLCALVYRAAEFRAVPARINFLLGALAAVRQVTPEAAEVFRATSAEGFAEVNGPLLLENESPLALQVFEEIIAGDWVEAYVKVDLLHRSVLPRRTRLPVLQTCAGLLERNLPSEVRAGIIETLFDYESRLWFGPAMYPPEPPPWDSATREALEFLVALATRVLAALPEDRLRAPVQSTREELTVMLRNRR